MRSFKQETRSSTLSPGRPPMKGRTDKELQSRHTRDALETGASLLSWSIGNIPLFAPASSGGSSGAALGKHDAGETLEAIPPEMTSPAPPVERIRPVMEEEAGQLARSGTIPDIGGPGVSKGLHEGAEDLPDVPRVSSNAPDAVPVVARIGLRFNPHRADGRTGGKRDAGKSNFALTFSQPGGRAVSPFGEESYEPKFSGISWSLTGGNCVIDATLEINCPWGTNSGGNTDVPSGTAAVVTKEKWREIRDDLTPAAASPHKSPRNAYYSKTLVERHEKYHGTDDWAWSQGSGHPLVKTKVEATNITPANAGAEVTTLLQACRDLLVSENFKYYKGGGAAHDSYAGEIRAYADGKAHYEQLAKDVENHGKTL